MSQEKMFLILDGMYEAGAIDFQTRQDFRRIAVDYGNHRGDEGVSGMSAAALQIFMDQHPPATRRNDE